MFQGSVVIQTKETRSENIEISIKKTASTNELFKFITVDKIYFPIEYSSMASILRLHLVSAS